eukprot:g34230.t1
MLNPLRGPEGKGKPLSAPQETRERKSVTVEEHPSCVYLYTEDDTDEVYGAPQIKHVGTIFEEAKQELLKLLRIEVEIYYFLLTIRRRYRIKLMVRFHMIHLFLTTASPCTMPNLEVYWPVRET